MIDEFQQKALVMFAGAIERAGPYKWSHCTPEPEAHRRWIVLLNVLTKCELHSAAGLKESMSPRERTALEDVHRSLCAECEAAREAWQNRRSS